MMRWHSVCRQGGHAIRGTGVVPGGRQGRAFVRSIDEDLIAAFFDLSVDACVIAGNDGFFKAANRTFQRLIGYTEAELCARPFYDFIHPDDHELTSTVVKALHADDPDVRRMDNRYLHRDGSVVWLEWQTVARGDLMYGSARDVTNLRESQARDAYRATHDPLTGCANRFQFDDRLNHAIAFAQRHGVLLHVIVMDLDGFKKINDTVGHVAGDKALVQVAARLLEAVRPSDTFARVGGDEFALLIESEPAEVIGQVIERLTEVMAPPIELEGHTFRLGISAGAATYPSDSQNAEGLVSHADTAMYQVKHARNQRKRS
jgi:diguanylate cyclase